VLSNPVCFLVAKFDKSAVKLLKSVEIDFYIVDELAEAKTSLLRDVDSIKSSTLHFLRKRSPDGATTTEAADT